MQRLKHIQLFLSKLNKSIFVLFCDMGNQKKNRLVTLLLLIFSQKCQE